jgi:hypothetical protein
MRARRSVFVFAVLTLVASMLLVVPVAGAQSGPDCDPDYVKVFDGKIKVLPTGSDDTANLQCALNLATTRPRAKVVLVADDYYTSFLEVEGFHGVVKGQGMGRTMLYTLAEGLDCNARLDDGADIPVLLEFAASDVTVRDLSIAIGGDAPCLEPWDEYVDPEEGWGHRESSIVALRATTHLRNDALCPGTVDHRLRVFRIGVESELPDLEQDITEYKNFIFGVAVDTRFDDECEDSWMRGPVIVQGSHIAGNGNNLRVKHVTDSFVKLGGWMPGRGNTLEDAFLNVNFQQNRDSNATIVRNDITGVLWHGVIVNSTDMGGEGPNHVVIAKNSIAGVWGIVAIDEGPFESGRQMLRARIARNDIELDDGAFGMLVIGNNGKLIRNRVTGTGEFGVFIDGFCEWHDDTDQCIGEPFRSSGWLVTRNRFPDFEPYFARYQLTDLTEHNTVMCTGSGHTVIDDGIDNTIVGCSLVEEPSEPSAATMERRVRSHPYAGMQLER